MLITEMIRGDMQRRTLAVLLVLCLLLSPLNLGSMVTYATGSDTVTFQVGTNVTAELDDGVLTLSGTGDTEDYGADTAPFGGYAADIHTLVIEEGVTSLGSYLFYGLGELSGDLTLPESIVLFGDCVFSGDSLENAPHFTIIRNLFESGEITQMEPEAPSEDGEAAQEPAPPTQEEPSAPAQPEEETPAPDETDPPQDGEPETDPKPDPSLPEEPSPEQPAPDASETPDPQPEPDSPNENAGQESEQAPETNSESKDDSAPSSTESSDSGDSPAVTTASVPVGLTAKTLASPLGVKTIVETPVPLTANLISSHDEISAGGSEVENTENVPEPPQEETEAPSGDRYTVETITEQEIAHPDTLFYPGQSGVVLCSDSNKAFLESVQLAGYELADATILVTLDDTVEQELPVVSGRLTLPACPPEISSPDEDDVFFTHVFSGWRESQSEDSPLLSAGELLDVGQSDRLALYSAWESSGSYQLKVQTEIQEDTAVYTLQDGGTGRELSPPEGYRFLYQWQIAARGDGATWLNIEGAESPVYQRRLDPLDSGRQLRCGVTAVRLSRALSLHAPTLYSDPVNAAVEVTPVYVDQTNGNDTNDGSENTPVQTLDAAAKKLKKATDGGTVETNQIVIMGTYQLEGTTAVDLLRDNPVPVTITGSDENATFIGLAESGKDVPFNLYDDLCFKSISVKNVQHIYGQGHNITIGEGVKNSLQFYLYGSGQNTFNSSVGSIEVYSGKFARIIGYVRSNASIDVKHKSASITVGGSADVGSIVAGSASGEIKNADVTINMLGGYVGTLIGGNQGYENNPSPYSGNTTIKITGGKVKNLYGAGSGRTASIPTFSGALNIQVSGGTVENLYGSGSAALVNGDNSSVTISVNGSGNINNIFAAGQGGDTGVGLGKFPQFTVDPSEFGSLTGTATITVGGDATVGNIYASGEGYTTTSYDVSSNAYLNGNATIRVEGGTVTGSIYGGGKGITGYEACARVTNNSTVKVEIAGGTVKGNVYGGGQTAKMEGDTTVTLSGGTIEGNLYGGGFKGPVEGSTTVDISNGTVNGSVYGGARGAAGSVLVNQGSTVNMEGGWIRGNLYGGSEFSNDGKDLAESSSLPDLVFVNLVGGTVDGNVFGGGYQGIIHGSTHLHIGNGAMGECAFYQNNSGKQPSLTASALAVGGSVYAGGDYGGDTLDYNAITVKGTSHVYIDGTDYDTGGSSGPTMIITGGIFGSGASCDAGSTRLVTLKNYGEAVKDSSGKITGATRTLPAIQRADRVLLLYSHVKLTGQSDIANENQTQLYSLNRIGDHDGNLDGLGKGLVLQGGSTLVLEKEATELSRFSSVTDSGTEVTLDGIITTPNTLLLSTGTTLRVAHTKDGALVYGQVSGYTYLLASESVVGYAYARISPSDGGFADSNGTAITFIEVPPTYRYWKLEGIGDQTAVRETVLTAKTLDSGADTEGYAVATGTIELPLADKNSMYTIKSVTIPSTLSLVEAAKTTATTDDWVTSYINNPSSSGIPIDLSAQKQLISNSPLNTFGLYMQIGSGFAEGNANGKVISKDSAISTSSNTVIGATTAGAVTGNNISPKIEFYLTYRNNITASQNLGKVQIEVQRTVNGSVKETTTMNVEIVTKATALTNMTIDLYATQTGSYTGKLIIPAGNSRTLSLIKVDAGTNSNLVSSTTALTDGKFSVSMQAVKDQGWQSSGLNTNPCDLGSFTERDTFSFGITDSRFDAPMTFTVSNISNFTEKDAPDTVTLTVSDSSTATNVIITLKIHWKGSVVSQVSVGAGRQYNGMSNNSATPTISQKSAVTANFTLSTGGSDVSTLWLELHKGGRKVSLPGGTKLTLLGLSKFYSYTVTETETDQILLTAFTAMNDNGHPSETIRALGVIVDFGSSDSLPPEDYSLRLRSETSADSIGANFIVNNSSASSTLSTSGGDGLSRGTHTFQLTVSAGSDTRLANGAAVVLSDSSGFPEGVVFTYDSKRYYPSGGKVYLPLRGSGSYQITMETTNTSGLSVGDHTMAAQVFPFGVNAGSTAKLDASTSYSVKTNPTYGLQVSMDSAQSRVIQTDETARMRNFTVQYSMENAGTASQQISVDVLQKSGGTYTAVTAPWTVNGNATLSPGSGTQSITVTVPEELNPGTYRLLFRLGDQEVPYNLIVQGR